jgi:hypothetical protein
MTKLFVLFILSLFFLFPVVVFGQHDLVVQPSDGYLNDVVAGDTTANGDRVDLERVYVLQRDSVYFVNVDIQVDGFDVRMRAEDGSGTRPVIYMTVRIADGTYPGQIFGLRNTGGNLWIKDLIMVGYIEALDDIQNIPSGLIRVYGPAAGFDIEIDGCLLTENRGQHIRTEGACRVVKVTNSTFTNMGDLGRSNFGAGKAIDLRDTGCDTLLFRNNTFVNFMDRIIRHRSSVGAINHLIFDHNTVLNGSSFHGTLALGWMGEEAVITNNLFFDSFIFGNDTDATRQAEFEEHGEIDPRNGLGAMRWIFSVPNDSTNWTVSHNYYSISDSVQKFYDDFASEGVTGEGDRLTHHIKARLGADSVNAFTKELFSLNNTPRVPTNMGRWYRDPNGANKTKVTTNFVRERDDYDRKPWEYFNDTLDAKYPQTTAAFTGAVGGYPVGDLNWWEGIVGINEPGDLVISEFRLKQNYPNPFNPSTSIEFVLSKAGRATLDIYNVVGQKVATLVDGKMVAGDHEIVWDASTFASGIYFYKLNFEGSSQTKKMMLIK